jgi:MoaE-MoaD fusion protein
MMVAVRMFAGVKDLASSDVVRVEVPKGATVAQLRSLLKVQVPALGLLLERSAIAVNGEFAEESACIGENDEIALLPPVSGG